MKQNTDQIYHRIFEEDVLTLFGKTLCKEVGIDPETLRPR